jgi:hypothetical protein
MGTELIFVAYDAPFLLLRRIGNNRLDMYQSYPFNLDACGAAVNSVNSDKIFADACGRAAVRPHAAVRRVKNGP